MSCREKKGTLLASLLSLLAYQDFGYDIPNGGSVGSCSYVTKVAIICEQHFKLIVRHPGFAR